MKIILHSGAPWGTSGYSQQTAIFARLFRDAGHEVVISAYWGLGGSPADWGGIKVLTSQAPGDPHGTQMLAAHFAHENADLVITLCDIWVLEPQMLSTMPVAHWLPVDCEPLSEADRICMDASSAVPVAMSRFGERMLREGGFDPLYVPHGCNPAFLGPVPDRSAAKAEFGVAGKFVIGVNAANKDPYRKGMAEQFEAFARLHAAHPDTVLLVHALIAEPGGLSLEWLAGRLGIPDGAVRYVDQYALLSGQVPLAHLVTWYAALDLYSGCAYGEGFGLPLIESQALGCPVVVTDASAMTEMCGAGWTVTGERFWNTVHRSWWVKPHISEIYDAYEEAYALWHGDPGQYGRLRDKAREFAQPYHAERVAREYWVPALAELEQRLVTGRASTE